MWLGFKTPGTFFSLCSSWYLEQETKLTIQLTSVTYIILYPCYVYLLCTIDRMLSENFIMNNTSRTSEDVQIKAFSWVACKESYILAMMSRN